MSGLQRVLTADRGDAARRLDVMLRRRLGSVPGISRTRVQAWIERGQVSVNGTTVHRVATRLAVGDLVGFTIPDIDERPVRHHMVPEDVRLDVLYEDDHLIAVDKPAGVVVHPSYRNTAGTLLNALLWRARTWPAPQRPSIVGRLDKLTSGIVVVAKTATAHAALQRAMAARDAEKDYLAVVYGRVDAARGAIALRLRRHPGDRRRVVAAPTSGAHSLTRFERLACVGARRTALSLVRCSLVTGRTHQIRVHLAARGWPLVGDPLYGEPRWTKIDDPVLASTLRTFPRQALHAWRLGLTHPTSGARLLLEARIPPDMEALLSAAGLVAPPSHDCQALRVVPVSRSALQRRTRHVDGRASSG